MKHPKELEISAFDYDLPESKIAAHPAAERDSSRLLVWRNGHTSDDVFGNLTAYLPEGALMIFNNSRVVEARLLFQKLTGARIELFCLEPGPFYPDITAAFARQGSVEWKCLVGNASAWPHGLVLEKRIKATGESILLQAQMLKKEQEYFLIRFTWTPDHLPFAEVLHHAGVIPLPPYMKRKADEQDAERYQTIYADPSGSVAAPTAGLHFTAGTMKALDRRRISKDFVTLHVGAGTFRPVKTDTMEHHLMHAETIEVTAALVENIRSHCRGNIIAVGTTSLRTLESLYWLGRKIFLNKNILHEHLSVNQWDPYEDAEEEVVVEDALTALIQHMHACGKEVFITKTSLLIAPGYRFRIVNILVTNFHQPRSTLLLLVAAFIGDNWKSAYSYALDKNFRFLSYGDACLLFRQ